MYCVTERVRNEEHVSVSINVSCIGAVQRGVMLLHLACVNLLALAGASKLLSDSSARASS